MRGAARIFDGKGGQIIEQAFAAGKLRRQHHADQEKIDVESFPHAIQCVG